MCGSMADIQSPTAEIRRGKIKKKEQTTGQKYIWSALLHRATINKERNLTQWKTGYSPRPPTSSDWNEILHSGWSSDGSSKIRISSKSVKQFRSCGGSKFAHLYWLGHWLIQQLVLPYKLVVQAVMKKQHLAVWCIKQSLCTACRVFETCIDDH